MDLWFRCLPNSVVNHSHSSRSILDVRLILPFRMPPPHHPSVVSQVILIRVVFHFPIWVPRVSEDDWGAIWRGRVQGCQVISFLAVIMVLCLFFRTRLSDKGELPLIEQSCSSNRVVCWTGVSWLVGWLVCLSVCFCLFYFIVHILCRSLFTFMSVQLKEASGIMWKWMPIGSSQTGEKLTTDTWVM